MKKNDRRIDRVYSFFNAIRGNNTPNEYEYNYLISNN